MTHTVRGHAREDSSSQSRGYWLRPPSDGGVVRRDMDVHSERAADVVQVIEALNNVRKKKRKCTRKNDFLIKSFVKIGEGTFYLIS